MRNWIKLAEERFKFGWRKLVRRKYSLPDNTEDEYITHDDAHVVAVVVIDRNGNVVLGREFRPGPEQILDELAAGNVEEDESPVDAAAREVREELGYTGRLIPLGSSWSDAYSNRIRFHFVMQGAVQTHPQKLDPGEFIEVIVMTRQEFVEYAEKGQHTNDQTALRALRYLKW